MEVSADPASGHPSQSVAEPSPTPGATGSSAALRSRRDALAEEVTELHWDLGGLAYEMAIRDHFRLDVLVRRAALLQERDAELAEVERLLAMEDTATIGDCPQCGAPHSRGAVFCWQCGVALMERSAPTMAESESAHTSSAAAHSAAGSHVLGDSVQTTSSAPIADHASASGSAHDDAAAVMDRLLAPSAPPRADASSPSGASSRAAPSGGSRLSTPPSSSPDR